MIPLFQSTDYVKSLLGILNKEPVFLIAQINAIYQLNLKCCMWIVNHSLICLEAYGTYQLPMHSLASCNHYLVHLTKYFCSEETD